MTRVIGRIAFWLLLPGLIATVIEIALLIGAGFGPRDDESADRLTPLIVAVVLLVLLGSLTLQAVLILRRPQTLSARALPTPIAVQQILLYAVVALWVALACQTSIGALSTLFAVAVVGESIAILVLILRWKPTASAALTEVELPLAVRVALWAFCLIALVTLMYGVASSFTPALDPAANRAFIVLSALGLPFSILVLPITVVALLLGFAISMPAVAAVGVLGNIACALLLLWPRTRLRFVNWFFRLAAQPKPDLDALAEDGASVAS